MRKSDKNRSKTDRKLLTFYIPLCV